MRILFAIAISMLLLPVISNCAYITNDPILLKGVKELVVVGAVERGIDSSSIGMSRDEIESLTELYLTEKGIHIGEYYTNAATDNVLKIALQDITRDSVVFSNISITVIKQATIQSNGESGSVVLYEDNSIFCSSKDNIIDDSYDHIFLLLERLSLRIRLANGE